MMEKRRSGEKLKLSLKILWITFIVTSFIYWYPKIDQLLCKNYNEISKFVSIDDGWNITINNKMYEDVTLTDFTFEPLNKGDILIMERVLPEDWDIKEACLRFTIHHSTVKIFVDGEEVYEYGSERFALNKALGSGIQLISFADEYKGKNIRIELVATEKRSFSTLDSFRLYHAEVAVRALLTENRIPLFVGCFLTIFGLVILILTACAMVFSKKYIRLLCISAFSLCIGLWTLCYNDVTLAFSIPLYSSSLIEYMALYLAPIPFFVYMKEHVDVLKNKFLKVCYWLILSLQVSASVVILSLHTADIVHSTAVLEYMQILIAVMLIYLVFILILNLKNSDIIGKLNLAGMLFILFGSCCDLFTYYLKRYNGDTEINIKGISSVATLVYVFILIIGFYVNVTKKMMQDAEREFLIKRAYTDELTNLYNRRYCAELLNKYDAEERNQYAIVCFDLNDLKKVNDTLGHVQGDNLIQNAARLIYDVFHKNSTVGRMGGDEFIAIVSCTETEVMNDLLEQLEQKMKDVNQNIKEFEVSLAYGYAFSTELKEIESEKVYQMADGRMYEKKKQMKRQMKKQKKEN